jgi:hypothetical protein
MNVQLSLGLRIRLPLSSQEFILTTLLLSIFLSLSFRLLPPRSSCSRDRRQNKNSRIRVCLALSRENLMPVPFVCNRLRPKTENTLEKMRRLVKSFYIDL